MNSESFVSILTSLSREELAEYIRQKGKEPKMIAPFVILSLNDSAISKTKNKRKGGR